MFKIEVCIVLALLISFCMPSTCGGNCPSNTCTSCPCGTTVEHTVNVKEKCHRYNWNTNCCYCISTKRSGNSPGHMKFYKDSEGKVHELEGLFLLDKGMANSICPGKRLCNNEDNIACAYEFYLHYARTWQYFGTQAKQCGCLSSEEEMMLEEKESNEEAALKGINVE